MRLDWALLANGAEAPPNGLVYILGAGFDTLVRDKFPTPFNGVIVLRLQTTRLEAQRPHKVQVHCSDEDGEHRRGGGQPRGIADRLRGRGPLWRAAAARAGTLRRHPPPSPRNG